MIDAPGQRVASLRFLGTWAALLCQRIRLELERHRDVETAAPLGCEALHGRKEPVERREQALVAHLLACDPSKRVMDQRRLAVCDGIADDGITIHETGSGRGFSETAAVGVKCGRCGAA